ncbi:MAG: HDIG domain-containing protein [Candidatus Eiseniibacteriota bacterium]|nr:MAG: HDIG domain-containing protein [Candidatus Eisenbacteria bacterium]
MTREEAFRLVKASVSSPNLVKHMLAVEAVMKKLAGRLGQDEETWTLVGLLHDLDYDSTAKDPARHGLLTTEMLSGQDLPPEVPQAIQCHAGHCEPATDMDRALVATDPLTGLIVAAALMHPTKKLRNVEPSFVMNRFREKSFARGANREQIEGCASLGLELEEFVAIGLEAMTEIDRELGL